MKIYGIDVSHHQGAINWQRTASELRRVNGGTSPGFAILRVGYSARHGKGGLYMDGQFLNNLAACEKYGVAEFFCVVYVLYKATSIMKNMLLCGLPLPAGLREKVAKFLDTMTDETAINMQAEISGANKGRTVTGHLDTAQLETMSLEALHKLADGLEVEYTEDTPLKQLAEKIAAVEVTTEI